MSVSVGGGRGAFVHLYYLNIKSALMSLITLCSLVSAISSAVSGLSLFAFSSVSQSALPIEVLLLSKSLTPLLVAQALSQYSAPSWPSNSSECGCKLSNIVAVVISKLTMLTLFERRSYPNEFCLCCHLPREEKSSQSVHFVWNVEIVVIIVKPPAEPSFSSQPFILPPSPFCSFLLRLRLRLRLLPIPRRQILLPELIRIRVRASVQRRPFRVFLEQAHSLDVIILVGREAVV